MTWKREEKLSTGEEIEMSWLLNMFRRWWRKRVEGRFLKCLESEVPEEFLELLLKLMSLAFKIDNDFRRNIEGFTGRYQFRSTDNSVTIAAVFTGKDLEVKERLIQEELREVSIQNLKDKGMLDEDGNLIK